MDADKREMYWMGITVIEAQQILLQLNIETYPHQKREDARRFHRQMHELAYPKTYAVETGEVFNTEDLARKLGGFLNG